MAQERVAPDFRTDLITGLAGHDNVSQNNVGHDLPGLFQCRATVIHYGKRIIFIGENYPYNLSNGDTVIGEEQFVAHLFLHWQGSWH